MVKPRIYCFRDFTGERRWMCAGHGVAEWAYSPGTAYYFWYGKKSRVFE